MRKSFVATEPILLGKLNCTLICTDGLFVLIICDVQLCLQKVVAMAKVVRIYL